MSELELQPVKCDYCGELMTGSYLTHHHYGKNFCNDQHQQNWITAEHMENWQQKATPTPRRIAAALMLLDLEIVTDYWEERHPSIADKHKTEDINEQMRKITQPFIERLAKIACGVSVVDLDCE